MQEQHGYISSFLYPIYSSVILLYAGGCVGLTWMAAPGGRSHADGKFDHGTSYFGSIVFGTLTFCVSITGYKTYKMLNKYVLSDVRKTQVAGVTRVIVVYCFVFFARTMWDIL